MAEKELRLQNFTITQAVYADYWVGYDSDIFATPSDDEFSRADLISLMSAIKSKLETDEVKKGDKVEAPIEVKTIVGILHDKDERVLNVDDYDIHIKDPKIPHVHIYVELTRRVSLPKLAERIGVAPQFLEPLRKGRNAKENMLAYLVHARTPEKHLYDPREVETLGTFDYLRFYAENYNKWENFRATKVRKAYYAPQVDKVVERILAGEIKQEHLYLDDELFKVYGANKRRIEEAFELYNDRKIYKALDRIERGEIKLQCFYVTGRPGSGKTYTTQKLISLIRDRTGWDVFQTGATHPLDDYAGQEIIFMDDVRPSALGASDWLKLLDPINSSPISARYKNRTPVAYVLFITSYYNIDEFFYYVRDKGSSRSEALDQFLRRIAGQITVIESGGERKLTYQRMEQLPAPRRINVIQSTSGKEFVPDELYQKYPASTSSEVLSEVLTLNYGLQLLEGAVVKVSMTELPQLADAIVGWSGFGLKDVTP